MMTLSLRRLKGRNDNKAGDDNDDADHDKRQAGWWGNAASSMTMKRKKKTTTEPAAVASATENARRISGVKRPVYRADRSGTNATLSMSSSSRPLRRWTRLPAMGEGRGGSHIVDAGARRCEEETNRDVVDHQQRGQQQQSQDTNVERFDELMDELLDEINTEMEAAAEISVALTRSVVDAIMTNDDEDDMLAELDRSSVVEEEKDRDVSSSSSSSSRGYCPPPDAATSKQRQTQYPTQHSNASVMADVECNHDENNEDDDVGDDDREISHLEDECNRLSYQMSQLLLFRCDRKYTREYYDLELRLKNATEELEAAREDRNLHFHHRTSGGGGGGGGIGVGCEVPPPSQSLPIYDVVGTIEVGTTNPEMATVTNDDGPIIKDEHQICEGMSAVEVSNSIGAVDPRRIEYQRIESEMRDLVKFSPDWFRLKEKIFELENAIDNHGDDDDDDEGVVRKEDDTPRVISVLLSSPGSMTFGIGGSDCDSPLSPSTPHSAPLGGEDENRGEARSRPIASPTSTSSYRNRSRDRSLEGVVWNGAICDGSPFLSSSPSSPPVFRIIRGSLSPPTSTDRKKSDNLSSPHRSISSGGSGRKSASPYHHVNGNRSTYCNALSDDDDDRKSEEAEEKDGEREARRIAVDRLRVDYASSSELLEDLPEFSKEWFDVKTRLVGLYDQIVRLEKSEGGSIGGDSESFMTTTKNDQSYMSGWSSVWSESEDDTLSHFDDLECVMVSEALKYQRQQQASLYDDDSDDDAAAREDTEMLLMRPQSNAASEISDSLVKRDAKEEEKLTGLRRNKSESASVMTANIDLEIPFIQAVDSTSDEVALLLNITHNQENDADKRSYYATIIQEQWKKYLACKYFISMRKRALRYHLTRVMVDANDYDTPRNQLRAPRLEFSPWQASSAVSIQNQWRLYTRCKQLVSMRHRAARYKAYIPHDRQRLNFYTVAAMMIQSHWRKSKLHQKYSQQVNMVVVIQSMLRKYWLSTGKLYTDRREVVFHSSSLGIRLQRCRDGFVRVRSVAESATESPPTSSSILRDGRIGVGDLVLYAVGINLCRPVTTNQWLDVVGRIRSAPLPKTLVLTTFPSKEVLHATLVIQSSVRLWLAKCSNDRKREEESSSAEIETAESSSYNTQKEPAKVLKLLISTTETDDVADGLHSMHMEALFERELEYHNEEEEQKEEETEFLVDRDDVSDPSHQINDSLLRDKIEQSAKESTSKDKVDCALTSPREFLPPRFLPSSGTPLPQDAPSPNDMSGVRVSVAEIRKTWEVKTSSPTSPENAVHYSKVRYMMKSPEEAKHKKNTEINLSRVKGEKERELTPVEKIKNLSAELIILTQRMQSLPKLSPEWTLSKIEVSLLADELKYLISEQSAPSQENKILLV